jgi:cytochrome b pre-mRNA-processing protein 3
LNPLNPLTAWRRRKNTDAKRLYGSIVAQARLPVFYQGLGVPDTLEGRFLVLSLHLFAVLHRLKADGAGAVKLAQDLADRFTADMETVLREIGIGDLAIPKKVRGLAASSAGLLKAYEQALPAGKGAVATVIAKAFPGGPSEAASRLLAHYLTDVVAQLQAQDFAALAAGQVRYPGAEPGEELGGEHEA